MSDQVNDGVGELHEQAKSAIEHRVLEQFKERVRGMLSTRGEQLKSAPVEMHDEIIEKHKDEDDSILDRLFQGAKAVYERAIERRGSRQAALDALQGAIGLPLDPQLRQDEIERREVHHEEAQRAAAGVGTGLTHEQLTEQNRINELVESESAKDAGERIGDEAWAQDPRTDRGGEAKTEPVGQTGREARDKADKSMREAAERRQARKTPLPSNQFSAGEPQTGEIKSDGTDSRWGG